jgi:hypothetical protein
MAPSQSDKARGRLRPAAARRTGPGPRRASWVIALIATAEKLWPQSSSVIALTLRVDTPWTYISASVATSAFSERW